MSRCVITVSPLPYPMTLGNGAARQVIGKAAGGEIDDVVQRLSGILVSKMRGINGWAVI